MARPLVSIVIPSYNYARYVGEAVDSVLRQTYEPLEIIVIDDGSTDDTRGRLATFGSAIRYIYQENRGLGGARNSGIRAATGEWVAFLDADDRWHPKKLQIQFDAVTNLEDVCFFGSPSCGWKEEPDPNPEVRRLTVREFLVWTPLTSSSAVVKRTCFDKVGLFDESLRSSEDRDMWLRLVVSFPSAIVTCPCVYYRSHPGQMSRNPKQMYECLAFVLKRFLEQHPEFSGLRSLADGFVHQDAGYAYLDAGNRWASVAHMTRSILSYPRPLNPRAKALAHALLGDRVFRRLGGGK